MYSINGARLLFGLERYCLWFCSSVATGFPVTMAVTLISWAYFTDILEVLPQYKGLWRSANSVLATVLFLLCIYTFFMVIWVGPGSPLDIKGFAVRDEEDENEIYGSRFEPNTNRRGISDAAETELESLSGGTEEEHNKLLERQSAPHVVNNVTAKDNGQMRFCRKCSCWKPDRTHHCRICKKCVLRMDHHCPWFATCIGFRNQKLFTLFLIYVVIFCFECFMCSFAMVFSFFRDATYENEYMSLNVLFLCIVSGIFGLSLFGFSGFAVYNVLTNRTTIEVLEGVRFKTAVANSQFRFNDAPTSSTVGNVFDIGKMHNFCEVFGANHWLWFLPVANSLGEGTSFPINREVWEDVQQVVRSELEAMSQDREFNERTRREREQYVSRMA